MIIRMTRADVGLDGHRHQVDWPGQSTLVDVLLEAAIFLLQLLYLLLQHAVLITLLLIRTDAVRAKNRVIAQQNGNRNGNRRPYPATLFQQNPLRWKDLTLQTR